MSSLRNMGISERTFAIQDTGKLPEDVKLLALHVAGLLDDLYAILEHSSIPGTVLADSQHVVRDCLFL